MKKQKNACLKALNHALNITIILIVVFTFSVLCGKLFFKRGFLGYSSYIVISSSMHPEYKVNSLVIVKYVPFKDLNVGDVVAFESLALNNRPAFHRITRFTSEGFYVKGDQNEYEDNQLITNETYLGKGIAKSYILGRYILIIKTWGGFVFFFLFPISFLFFLVFLAKKFKMRA